MTPQELYEETKSILDSDIQQAQQIQNDIQAKQQQLNQLTTKIIGNQKLVEGLKKVDGVSEQENT
ncbi:hypothetical protein [Hyphomonas sp.]|uniref:hypothetical protein n=1 Tax=Hyphomonas sp. TaxID=87 RepID=UPI000C9473DB|nr:hypothetical protein [Hyphomonas sp.]MAL43696.1 hypothetical protein [Hyphomonas sp.]|tara:strand:- start:460 stop:654 length:195 start_codon:yes stop_codon:yes gene_type:complete